ncbi:MAG: hypothetical protein QXR53_04565 [Candidatus Norongarragalinales archaeon]
MKKFTRSLERHKGIVFATTTPHGVGALHLRHKVPLYKIMQVADSLGLAVYSEHKHKHHLQFRNKKNELVGTLVNFNLLLLPKFEKTKAQAVELAQALLEKVH